ncbi:MAG: family 10 glycosylhydrolase [Spirulinaceae cyanobacterium]
MSTNAKKSKGCGCFGIPFSLIIVLLAGGYFLFTQRESLGINKFLSNNLPENIPFITSSSPEVAISPTTTLPKAPIPKANQQPVSPVSPAPRTTPTQAALKAKAIPQTPWQTKQIRGIYLSRYQVTNNASEHMIRERVRYYRAQGFNTIIHGVWGNACTMYKSEVMQKTLGYESCPNLFQDKWLDWLIDEAHKQGMEVHAYFEKGIKIDENSPAFDLAVEKGWIVPGVDRTHTAVDHYVLDVEIPEVAKFFTDILVEFVDKYPSIDAVQWDDYLGYHAELPGKVDRTVKLTKFVQNMIAAMKKSNPAVSFDLCHHNHYWAKRYFAADWKTWNVDRVFIQVYGEDKFKEELNYVKQNDGIAITERQFKHLDNLMSDPEVKSILVFPLSGKPEEAASELNKLTSKK